MSKNQTTVLSAVLILGILVVAWVMPTKMAWLVVAILMVVFMLVLGVIISNRPLGILINEQNVMSLSRFQTALWTIIIISAYLVIAVARIKHGVPPGTESHVSDPLNINLSNELLALLGISATALVGSPLIAATKKSKTPDTGVALTTAKQLVNTNNAPDSLGATPTEDAVKNAINNNAQGTLYKNPTINDASFSDMFQGDEVGNTAHVDLGKVQMFYFTLIVALAYVVALWNVLCTPEKTLYGETFSFPAFSSGIVSLLGISNAGYLANKGVDHTKNAG